MFKANKAAWQYFSTQPPGYRRTAIWYVVSAVRPETQAKRLATVIQFSSQQRRIIGPDALGPGKAPAAKSPAAKSRRQVAGQSPAQAMSDLEFAPIPGTESR